jgi:isoquinoline 1-oxidoreductase subunit alpha
LACACLLTVNRTVTTLEGLGAGHADNLHPVQRAWIDASVPQCGYCQNGQIMAAAALLAEKPKADERAIATAMDDVVCRCGTHDRIRKAIRAAQQNLAEVAR